MNQTQSQKFSRESAIRTEKPCLTARFLSSLQFREVSHSVSPLGGSKEQTKTQT